MDEYPESKRIKYEHSYAREGDQLGLVQVKLEDPLRISPEDLENIKKEPEQPETVEIKQEPGLEDEQRRVCSGEKCENVENERDEKPLMDLVGSEPCESAETNYFFANLGLVNSEAEVASCSTITPDFVPKAVFQEMQKMYQKAMADVKSLTKKLTTEKKRNSTRVIKYANNTKVLENDIKRLKQQLSSTPVHISKSASEQAMEKTVATLRKQVDKLMRQNKNFHTHLTFLKQSVQTKDITIKTLEHTLEQRSKILNLKKKEESSLASLRQQCEAKDAQCKQLEKKRARLSQTFLKINAKLTAQLSELDKLKLDMDIMDRSIIDSGKARTSLCDQLAVIEKEHREGRDNPIMVLKLQELQTSLNTAKARLNVTLKQLETERNNASIQLKMSKQSVDDYRSKCRELEAQVDILKSSVAALKATHKQKTDVLKVAIEERERYMKLVERCKERISSVKQDMQKKVEEANARQCQYCGF